MSKKCYPNYKQIYTDILNQKYPHKKEECLQFLQKVELSSLDIIELNKKIYGQKSFGTKENQQHRSYSEADILYILNYKKNYRLNNTQTANYFNLSRNTLAKWEKLLGSNCCKSLNILMDTRKYSDSCKENFSIL